MSQDEGGLTLVERLRRSKSAWSAKKLAALSGCTPRNIQAKAKIGKIPIMSRNLPAPHVRAEVSSARLVSSFIEQSDLLSFALRRTLLPGGMAAQLTELPLKETTMQRTLSFLCRRNAYIPPTLKRLATAFVNGIRKIRLCVTPIGSLQSENAAESIKAEQRLRISVLGRGRERYVPELTEAVCFWELERIYPSKPRVVAFTYDLQHKRITRLPHTLFRWYA